MFSILKKTIKPVGLMVMTSLIGTAVISAHNPFVIAEVAPEASPITQLSRLPQANNNGDYARFQHRTWTVVDTDPNGLNCRMNNRSYQELIDPRNSISLDIRNWSVVGTLKQGEQFQIKLGPAGMGAVYDTQQKPWVFVETTNKNTVKQCFVRANEIFIEPVSQ